MFDRLRDVTRSKAQHIPAGDLVLDAISHQYGTQTVLSDIALTVRQGTLVAFLGPSGSGKTTLLRIIGGLLEPTRGTVTVAGTDVTRMNAERRGFGFVFQHYALFPHLSVRRNVSFPLEVRRIPKDEQQEKVQRALEVVDLSDLADRMPAQLSGGQQQRVALARAIVFDPPVLLMDEPLGALDKRLRDDLQTQIRELQQELKITTIYVTHDQDEAFALADELVIMGDGEIIQTGSPAEVYNQPSTRAVGNLIGDQNWLTGTISSVGSTAATVAGDAGFDFTYETGGALREIEVGDGVVCGIRPENVHVEPVSAGRHEDSRSRTGKIISRRFRGRSARLRVEIDDTDPVFVIDAEVVNRLDLTEGLDVSVTWDDRDVRLIEHRPRVANPTDEPPGTRSHIRDNGEPAIAGN